MSGNAHVRFGGAGRGDLLSETTAWRLAPTLLIEVRSRKVHLAGVTASPDSTWVTQQARNLAVAGELEDVRYLVRDRDTKFTRSFDDVLITEGVATIRTPVRSPRANAVAERFVRTVRAECTDRVLVLSGCHLDRVLRRYVDHYNTERPHRGLELATPVPGRRSEAAPAPEAARSPGRVRRVDVLGGLIHEYHVDAA